MASPSSPSIEEAFLKLAKCFLEGPKPPDDRVLPPDTFRLQVWQVKGKVKDGLRLTIEGLTPSPEWKEVEVVFEGNEKRVGPKLWTGSELQFDLPPFWAEDPGARFVTVYIRREGAADKAKELKETQEEPKAIIRIVPAPLNSNAALDYDDHRPADDGED